MSAKTTAAPASANARAVVRPMPELAAAAEVVALTIAEFYPRQVMHLQHLLQGFPLLTEH
jgi:arginase